ncbi:ATP-grasp domain-containing protein [Bernardetia sp.]|uniref:ATP-grasp domain-containing protein n=1 Tax=Bernardetia sp. TaxID=1937974 RepID=UPI0025BD6FA9|nr:ATP-grasp domain-containing protein [Bernardetia sp.]
MKLYTEKLVRGEFSNVSFYAGIEAFYSMGFEIIEVENIESLVIDEDNVFFGSIDFVQSGLKKMNIQVPEHIDYPESLNKYYGRKISESTINTIANNPDSWNVFVKPKGHLKKFTGRHIKTTFDLIGCGDRENDVPVWVSEPVEFVSEWRVFVRYNQVLGVRPYKGDWRGQYNYKIIEEAISSYQNAPAGYAIDFGLTKEGKFLVVEVNEGYSIGNYGLFYTDYAKLLSARWAEMTNQVDLCNF